MRYKITILYVIAAFVSCNNNGISPSPAVPAPVELLHSSRNENPYPSIETIPLPNGFLRPVDTDSCFSTWLRQVALKRNKTVFKFDGSPKLNQSARFAVLDITTGNRDLQQCADAVMRLRAEYLFASAKYSAIRFSDNEGTVYIFKPPYTRAKFQQYLQKVFGMCGSASLSKQLRQKTFDSIAPGDVLIRGGFPGHAVIVMDVAINSAGKKLYLLAQSYMPAQDIHVLKNPGNPGLSPWYEVNEAIQIRTPEFSFTRHELKQW